MRSSVAAAVGSMLMACSTTNGLGCFSGGSALRSKNGRNGPVPPGTGFFGSLFSSFSNPATAYGISTLFASAIVTPFGLFAASRMTLRLAPQEDRAGPAVLPALALAQSQPAPGEPAPGAPAPAETAAPPLATGSPSAGSGGRPAREPAMPEPSHRRSPSSSP